MIEQINPSTILKKFLFFYILVYVLPNFYSLFLVISESRLIGDAPGVVSLDINESLYIFFWVIFPHISIICIPIFFLFSKRKFQDKGLSLFLLSKKIEILLFAIIIINLILTLIYDFAVLGKNTGSTGSKFSFITSIFPIALLFYINFIYKINYKKYSSLFFINLILFSTLQLIRGWTGFILTILFFYIISLKFSFKKYIVSAIIISLTFFYLYPALDSYKLMARGLISDYEEVNLKKSDYFDKLIGRISPFSNMAFIYQNSDYVKENILYYAGDFDYAKDFLAGVIPKKIIGLNSPVSLNQIINITQANQWIEGSSHNSPLLSRAFIYSTSDFIVFLAIFSISSFLIIFMLLNFFGYLGLMLGIYTIFNIVDSGNLLVLSYNLYACLIICLTSIILKFKYRLKK